MKRCKHNNVSENINNAKDYTENKHKTQRLELTDIPHESTPYAAVYYSDS